MKTRMKHNPKYKDRLFKLLLGSMEMHNNIILLNGTNYPLYVDLEITTLANVIYIKMKDDVFLLIDCRLSLLEQQSSFNGTCDIEPVVRLKLSDAFYFKYVSGEFEWTATVYNINKGKNDELLKKAKPYPIV